MWNCKFGAKSGGYLRSAFSQLPDSVKISLYYSETFTNWLL